MTRVYVVLFFWLVPAVALAHHPVTENGIAAAEPVGRLETTVKHARFDFEDVASGSWRAVGLRGEYPIASRVSLGVGFSLLHLVRDYGPDVVGTGDLDLYSRVLLIDSEHAAILVTAGLGVGLPTGNVELGLGSGHIEVSPHMIASSQLFSNMVAIGSIVQRSSVSSEEVDGEWHGSLVAPHQPHELDASLAIAVSVGDIYGKLSSTYTHDWSGRVEDPVRAAAELGWFRSQRWRLSMRVDAPLTGQRRSEFATSLSFSVMF